MIETQRYSLLLRVITSAGSSMRELFVIPLLLVACITPSLLAVPPTTDEIDAAIQRSSSGRFWGVALIVRDGETLLSKGYGAADYKNRPNTPDTLFEIASISKQFTATAILHLVHENRLQLDSTLGDLFPQRAAAYKDVTVEHLLSHTSGMNPNGGVPYNSKITRESYIKRVLSLPPTSPPGKEFAYSNVGYALLAAIVESVSGESFEEYAHEHLFRPAGLVDTGFINEENLDRSRVAARISRRRGQLDTSADWYYGWGYRGMGGVVTTANDLNRWSRALRTDVVLPTSLRDELFRVRTNDYALGWRVRVGEDEQRIAQHSGGVQGFSCFMMHGVDDENLVVLLSNGFTSLRTVVTELSDLFTQTMQSTLRIDVSDYEVGKTGRVQLGTGLHWNANRNEDSIALTLSDENSSPVHVELSIDSAQEFLQSLQRVLRIRGKDEQELEQTEADVYLFAYKLAPQVQRGGVTLTARPIYRGRNKDGVVFVDERVTITVVDNERNFWPIITKLNSAAAEALAAELSIAVTQQ